MTCVDRERRARKVIVAMRPQVQAHCIQAGRYQTSRESPANRFALGRQERAAGAVLVFRRPWRSIRLAGPDAPLFWNTSRAPVESEPICVSHTLTSAGDTRNTAWELAGIVRTTST
jgi:hypothetical protein